MCEDVDIPIPRVGSRRHSYKDMYLGEITLPIDNEKFDGKLLMNRNNGI